ncbi:hypothetical protein RQP46_008167 [Phenoliferia psychrophenolica]
MPGRSRLQYRRIPRVSESPPPFIPPRASFSDLPLELLANVAEHVAAQDVAYRDRTSSESLPTVIQKHSSYGFSLGAFALLSKACYNAAAPHQFKVFKASKATHPVAQLRVLDLHAHHVTEINFDNYHSGRASESLQTLVASRRFANLRALRLSSGAATSLIPNLLSIGILGTASDLAGPSFVELARRIRTLELGTGFDDTSIGFLLPLFPNLSRLTLLDTLGDDESDFLAAALRARADLRHLSVRFGEAGGVPAELVGSEWPSEVESLETSFFELTADQWEFVETFARSLKRLSISVHHALEDPAFPPHPSSTPHFPLLQHLDIYINDMDDPSTENMANLALEILVRLSASPITHLYITFLCMEARFISSLLEHIEDHITTLEFISVQSRSSDNRLDSAGSRDLAAFCSEKSIRYEQVGLSDPYIDDRYAGFRESDMLNSHSTRVKAQVVEALERTVDFAAERVAALKRDYSPEQAKHLVDVLRKAEGSRLAMLD